MTRFYLSRASAVSLALVFTCTLHAEEPGANKARNAPICKVYALNGLARDAQFVKWVADTIPKVISPGTWNDGRLLTYQADGKILVVYHNPAVQAEVAAFIDRLSEAKSRETAPIAAVSPGVPAPALRPGPLTQIVPAVYSAAAPLKAPEVLSTRMPYPVPPPLKQPKHLFHLILQGEGSDTSLTDMFKQLTPQISVTKEDGPQTYVTKDGKEPSKSETVKAPGASGSFAFIVRYEGDGIIDDTVAKMVTKLYELSAQQDARAATPAGCGVLGAVMSGLPAKSACAPAACQPTAGSGQPPGSVPAAAPAPPQGLRSPAEPASTPATTTPRRSGSRSSPQSE